MSWLIIQPAVNVVINCPNLGLEFSTIGLFLCDCNDAIVIDNMEPADIQSSQDHVGSILIISVAFKVFSNNNV